jgi:SSS family solute:Na+ symporter
LGGSFFALVIFMVEKYISVDGISNYISSRDGLGIHWLRQTFIFFVMSSVLYFGISYFDRSEDAARPAVGLRLPAPTSRVVSFSLLLLAILFAVYAVFY